MPTIASANVPPPKSWEEFEAITASAVKLRWASTKLFQHGRKGQAQQGVDISGHDDRDRQTGVQCKNTVHGISFNLVEAEIKNAEEFRPVLEALVIATTAPRDAVLQGKVRALSAKRKAKNMFEVDIFFWEDITDDLARNEDVFFTHYPQFRVNTNATANAHDLKLYNGILQALPSDGVIYFLDQNNMAGWPFENARLDPLRDFIDEWRRPEREFITESLDVLRQSLCTKAKTYLGIIAVDTFWVGPSTTRRSVPEDWELEQPERFDRVVKQLHDLAGEIVAMHTQFVREGRDLLIGPAA